MFVLGFSIVVILILLSNHSDVSTAADVYPNSEWCGTEYCFFTFQGLNLTHQEASAKCSTSGAALVNWNSTQQKIEFDTFYRNSTSAGKKDLTYIVDEEGGFVCITFSNNARFIHDACPQTLKGVACVRLNTVTNASPASIESGVQETQICFSTVQFSLLVGSGSFISIFTLILLGCCCYCKYSRNSSRSVDKEDPPAAHLPPPTPEVPTSQAPSQSNTSTTARRAVKPAPPPKMKPQAVHKPTEPPGFPVGFQTSRSRVNHRNHLTPKHTPTTFINNNYNDENDISDDEADYVNDEDYVNGEDYVNDEEYVNVSNGGTDNNNCTGYLKAADRDYGKDAYYNKDEAAAAAAALAGSAHGNSDYLNIEQIHGSLQQLTRKTNV